MTFRASVEKYLRAVAAQVRQGDAREESDSNPTQYFDGITPDLWTYQIGGCQVLAKWLKDRRGRSLTSADTIDYSRVVTSLVATVNLQEETDRIRRVCGGDRRCLTGIS